ncbi:MAG TPA: maleylacetate reductase [Roseiflexaceae bacterium]|nr:maleylacetate reductase [Roseiflexaceae bacterium]
MLQFIHESAAVRVCFGAGAITDLADEADRLGLHRLLLVSSRSRRALAQQAADILGTRAVGIHAEAIMHVPVDTVTTARTAAERLGCDGYVAIGGGSTVGLAKAIALESGLPIIAIPTTYAGSEMTPIWGLTEAGVKRTGRAEHVRPRTVIYDPQLTLGLPPQVAGPSGINALAHCVEALYAHDASPITMLIAEEGIRALHDGLPAVIRDPADLAARTTTLYGAWLAGAALSAATLGLHHKLCHTIGGSFNMPHAEVHTVILPHAAAYNASAAPTALARAARAMAAADAPQAIFDLAVALGAPTALRDIGMREADLDAAAELATRSPYPNPAPLTRTGIRQLLDDAFYGRRPGGVI